MLVSLFTDASYCERTGAAAWAAWMKWEGQMYRAASAFKRLILTAGEAEMGAAMNGLWLVMHHATPKRGEAVLLQSDCEEVLRQLVVSERGHPNFSVLFQEAAVYLNSVRATGVRVMGRHMKSHSKEGAPRNLVNDWCDREAKRCMREAREKISANSVIL